MSVDEISNQLSLLTGKTSSALIEEVNEAIKQRKIKKLRSELEKALGGSVDEDEKPKNKPKPKTKSKKNSIDNPKITFD